MNKNINILIKNAKIILKHVDLSNANISKLNEKLNPTIIEYSQKRAVTIYSKIVKSDISEELVAKLKNAKMLDFDELLKNDLNKILNEILILIKEILNENNVNLMGNINFAFSLWKTLAFGLNLNKFMEIMNCSCSENEGKTTLKCRF